MTSENGSKNKKHRHYIDLQAQEVMPADDGHMHDLVGELPFDAKPESKQDDDIIADAQKCFTKQLEVEKDSFHDAKVSEEFFVGEGQWPSDVKSKLKGEQRAALTFNHLQASIKTLSGFQRNNRSDFKFFPVEGGDEAVANVLDVVAKVICDMNNYHQEETEWFMDAMVAGRGNLRIWDEFTPSLEEEIKIRHVDWLDVHYDSHRRKDIEDLKAMSISKWLTKDEMKALFPSKKDDIDQYADDMRDMFNFTNEPHQQIAGKQYTLGDGKVIDLYDHINQKFRLVELWRREDIRSKVAMNVMDEATFKLDAYKPSYIKDIETLDEFVVVEVPGHRMRVTEFGGGILFRDEYPELAEQDFPIVPLYCDKTRDFFWSKIHVGKDAQMEINKRLSQFIDILNRYAVFCHYYNEETFSDPSEENNFKQNATKVGGIYKLAVGSEPPGREEGSKVPMEIIAGNKEMLSHLREILNINPEMLGSSMQSSESGVAQMQRVKQAMTGNEFLFDNLRMAKRKLGKKLVHHIQHVYADNPEALLNMLGTEAMKREVKIAGEQYDPTDELQRNAVMQMLNSADLTKYDISIEESSESPTIRMQVFLMLGEMIRNGVPIPLPEWINLSPIPKEIKDRMMQEMQAQQQQQAQQEAMPYETEIQKTLITAQSKQQDQQPPQPQMQ